MQNSSIITAKVVVEEDFETTSKALSGKFNRDSRHGLKRLDNATEVNAETSSMHEFIELILISGLHIAGSDIDKVSRQLLIECRKRIRETTDLLDRIGTTTA